MTKEDNDKQCMESNVRNSHSVECSLTNENTNIFPYMWLTGNQGVKFSGNLEPTLRWAVLTVLWIGFCHTGPMSLCILHICCVIVSRPDMTYNVFGGTLNLAQSIQSTWASTPDLHAPQVQLQLSYINVQTMIATILFVKCLTVTQFSV